MVATTSSEAMEATYQHSVCECTNYHAETTALSATAVPVHSAPSKSMSFHCSFQNHISSFQPHKESTSSRPSWIQAQNKQYWRAWYRGAHTSLTLTQSLQNKGMILAFSRVTPWYVDRKPQNTNTAKPQLFYGTPKETQKDIRQGAMETRAHLRSENSQQETSSFWLNSLSWIFWIKNIHQICDRFHFDIFSSTSLNYCETLKWAVLVHCELPPLFGVTDQSILPDALTLTHSNNNNNNNNKHWRRETLFKFRAKPVGTIGNHHVDSFQDAGWFSPLETPCQAQRQWKATWW